MYICRKYNMKKLIPVNLDKVVYIRLKKYTISDLFIISQVNNVLFEIILAGLSNNLRSLWVDTSNQNIVMLHCTRGISNNGDKYDIPPFSMRRLVSMKSLKLQKITPTVETLERYLYFMTEYKDYLINDIDNFEDRFRNIHFDNLIHKMKKDINRSESKKNSFNNYSKFEVNTNNICLN